MSTLALLAATPFECSRVIESIRQKRTSSTAGLTFVSGVLDTCHASPRVVLCVSGIGKANAARAATLLIARTRPSLLVNFGVGGAYEDSRLSIGDVVIADREHYGDEGVRIGHQLISMEGLGLPLLETEQGRFFNSFPLHVPKALARHARVGGFVTVSSCTGTGADGRRMEQRWNALCENMEGAALAHVALAQGIPLIELRSISNIIEDRSGNRLDRSHLLRAADLAQDFFLTMWNKGAIRA